VQYAGPCGIGVSDISAKPARRGIVDEEAAVQGLRHVVCQARLGASVIPDEQQRGAREKLSLHSRWLVRQVGEQTREAVE